METLLVGGPARADADDSSAVHYHDASHHGLAWASINELLHVIVFVFALFGMIKFEVKFISAPGFVKWASRAIIAFNFYVSLKFALLALAMYLYNYNLEARGIEISALNCTLSSYTQLLAKGSTNQVAAATATAASVSRQQQQHGHQHQHHHHRSEPQGATLAWLTWLVNTHGGPYKLLGNRATLMYGVYSIAIFIMLALFPYELATQVEVGFNFIRFVLSDPKCMRDLYNNRKKHLARLASWSRTEADSLFTQGAKMILSQRDLRTNYTSYCARRESHRDRAAWEWREQGQGQKDSDGLSSLSASSSSSSTSASTPAHRTHTNRLRVWARFVALRRVAPARPPVVQQRMGASVPNNRPGGYILGAPVRQLTPRTALTSRGAQPSVRVAVAQRNLRHFKPFVRSDTWFKASMVIYPYFILCYFILLTASIGIIQLYVDRELHKVVSRCDKLAAAAAATTNVGGALKSAQVRDFGPGSWSWLDWLLYYENYYLMLVTSCSSGFYCSYYFGTITELSMWLGEISQQLSLCTRVIEITDVLTHHARGPISSGEMRRLLSLSQPRDVADIGMFVNEFGGLKHLFANWRSWWRHGSPRRPMSAPRFQELMAARLLDKKETLLRATYLNVCLFFDELNETRFMTTTTLSRTTLMCGGFALMAAITRSQFKANYGNLYYLLGSTFFIFNVYLACGAYINSRVNKMLVQIHSLISASLRTDSEDADLLEFWLRHVNSFGQDKNTTAYEIYGYKVTWSAVLNIDSVILSLYFMTD